jgi:ribonuclease HI
MGLRLETEGPTGEVYKQSSNRAELRAVIAALQFTDWSTDCNGGWRSLVIATDSEYVAVNITQRIKKWGKEGWKTFDHSTKRRQDVKNQDLWKLLLSLVRTLQGEGVEVSFWRIPRASNERADRFAKYGAEHAEVPHFVMVQPDGPTDIKFKPYPY